MKIRTQDTHTKQRLIFPTSSRVRERDASALAILIPQSFARLFPSPYGEEWSEIKKNVGQEKVCVRTDVSMRETTPHCVAHKKEIIVDRVVNQIV